MGKMTYSEQLRHPQWQRKRLEVLNYFSFTCQSCSSTEKTLHVHHKQYKKGNFAWDYPLDDFEVLCEECHKLTHDEKTLLNKVISLFPSSMIGSLSSLLIGFGNEDGHVDIDYWVEADSKTAQAGRLAWLMMDYEEGECLEIVNCFMQLGPDRFIQAIREVVQKDNEGL